MKEITEIEEIQKIALDILLYIHKVCEKHHLKYFISDGTLLGAVRHKGYIPWDDDLDIWMPREDYRKIVSIINEEESPYKVVNYENTPNYIYTFAKVIDTRTKLVENIEVPCELGVYVDIFQYDGLPGNKPEDFKKHVDTCMFWQRQRMKAFFSYTFACKGKKKGNPRLFLNWALRRMIGGRRILQIMDHYATRYPVEGARYVGCLGGGYKAKDMMPAQICQETIDMEFEGHLVKAPIGYEQYLTIEYGDYMTLPPVEQRVTHHDFKAWWR